MFLLKFRILWNLFVMSSVLHTCENVDFLQTNLDVEIIKNENAVSK